METSPNNTWELDPSTIAMLELVGSGSNAEVFRGHLNGREVAVKRIHSAIKHGRFVGSEEDREEDRRSLQRDMEVFKRISHLNLVKVIGITSTEYPFQIISEYCVGGCLFELLHNRDDVELEWSQQLKMASDVANGMDFLHKCDPPILHRDLKSLNLLLKQAVCSVNDIPHVKVTDFSFLDVPTRNDWGSRRLRFETPPYWKSPEDLGGTTSSKGKGDIYSYAMILFEVICREIPFEDEEPWALGRLVVQGARPDMEAVPPDCPEVFRNLMIMCWDHDAEKRPSFELCSSVLAPMMRNVIVTLHLQCNHTRLSCTSLSGNELLGLDICDAYTQKFGEIRSKINDIQEFGALCTGPPRLVLPSGQLVDATSDKLTVAEVLF